MSPWGLLLGAGLFLFSERVEGATGRGEGKSVTIVVEGKDAGEALRVARASVAATDLFDELSGARRQPALNLRGKLVEGSGGVRGGEVAYLPLTQGPRVQFSALRFIDSAAA